MEEPLASESPLVVDTVECSPSAKENLAIRLQGRWQDRRRSSGARPMLVVEVDGRLHRFPAVPPPRLARLARPGTWGSNFSLPGWLEPLLEGHTKLSIGDVEFEVRGFAPSGEGVKPPASGDPTEATGNMRAVTEAQVPQSGAAADTAPGPSPSSVSGDRAAEDGATGALRNELQERAAAQARIQGELADARAELEARITNQERLRATHDQLRAELERLSGLVGQHDKQRAEVESKAVVLAAELSDAQAQVGELLATREELVAERDVLIREVGSLRSALAAGIVSSDAATAEADGLRDELARLGAELAAARQAMERRESGLDEAEALLGEARALSASLREP